MAAIRELFEEAGVLLADAGRGIEARDPAARERARPWRDDASRGRRRARPAASDRPARPAVALGHAGRSCRAVSMPGSSPRCCRPAPSATFEGGEVVDHVWLRPTDALDAMADGRLALWLPTSSTLQQLEQVDARSTRSASTSRRAGSDPVEVETLDPTVTRIVMPAGGGVAGQPVCAYLVGRQRFVLFDPGDPTGPAARARARAREGGRRPIEAIALTHVDPDHAAGAEASRRASGSRSLAGPGAGRALPYEVREVDDVERPRLRDVAIRAVHTPGPRPEHLAFIVGDARFVVTGDLDGVRGARMSPHRRTRAGRRPASSSTARSRRGCDWPATRTPDATAVAPA